MKAKTEIQKLLSTRAGIIKKNENDPAVDILAGQIIYALDRFSETLEIDFIIESLTHLGHAPNLIYDDNGMFALSGSGYGMVVTGNDRAEGAFTSFIRKRQWKRTIRAAVAYHLKTLKRESRFQKRGSR